MDFNQNGIQCSQRCWEYLEQIENLTAEDLASEVVDDLATDIANAYAIGDISDDDYIQLSKAFEEVGYSLDDLC